MTLKISGVREKGVLDKERLVLTADSNEDIGQYVLFNTTSTVDNEVSNRVRRTLWLPDYQVEAGDLVVIYTKRSVQAVKEKKNDDGTKTVFIYWGKSEPVWNLGNDAAVLVKMEDWDWKKV
jgi:hypothetical protein